MGLRDFKNEIMWNCVITGNVLCAELYTSSRNTIISNETCRYIIPGCYTKRTSEIEIILQENRNRYARDTHLFPRPTIVKNTPLIYLLSWIIMFAFNHFLKFENPTQTIEMYPSIVLVILEKKKKERKNRCPRTWSEEARADRLLWFHHSCRSTLDTLCSTHS